MCFASNSRAPATFDEQLAYDQANGSKSNPNTIIGYDDKGNPVYGQSTGSNYGINLNAPGGYESSIQREVSRRRGLLTDVTALPADTADLYVKNVGASGVRKARRGSTGSLLGSFDPGAPLGPSLLGGE